MASTARRSRHAYKSPRKTSRPGKRRIVGVALACGSIIILTVGLLASSAGATHKSNRNSASERATGFWDRVSRHQHKPRPTSSPPAPIPTTSTTRSTQPATASPTTQTSSTPAPPPPSTPSSSTTATSSDPAPSGGKPGATNTGVPAGTALKVVNGDQTYSTPDQVVSGLDIHGFVRITAKNVTIKNSIIRGGTPRCVSAVLEISGSASATVEDSEIYPAYPNACLDGVWATNTTLLRMNIHGSVDGVKANDNTVVQDSWIHDLSWFDSDANQGGGPSHNDDVQTFGGNEHITLRHNNMSPGPKGNSAYQVTQDEGHVSTDLHIDSNWLDGGGCTLNLSSKGGPTPMTGIYVTNNRFGRNSEYQCPILLSTQTILSQNSGNVWDDTGTPIPPPQVHD
jgi:hypothetical protein